MTGDGDPRAAAPGQVSACSGCGQNQAGALLQAVQAVLEKETDSETRLKIIERLADAFERIADAAAKTR